MKAHQLINADSHCTEWYTPPEIIEAARECLGMIQYDPFSCNKANETVKAVMFSSKDYGEDGFELEWGNLKIWCNHPFSRENNKRIASKAVGEFKHGAEIVMITFAATSEKWFQPLLDYPQCFLYGRTNYLDQQGNRVKGVTKGSVVTYLGLNVQDFYRAFKHLGKVKIPYKGE